MEGKNSNIKYVSLAIFKPLTTMLTNMILMYKLIFVTKRKKEHIIHGEEDLELVFLGLTKQ